MYGLAGNGALLLTTASLLAWPVCAWAGGHPEALPASSSVSSVSDVDTYGAYVTLDIGQDRELVLRLDLGDTDRVCSPSVPSVYGQSLHSKPDGQGRGRLTLGDDESGSSSSVQARWRRECITEKAAAGGEAEAVEVAQSLNMTLESVDGHALVPEVSFVAVLASAGADAGQQSVVSYSLRLESEDFARRPKTYVHSSTFGRPGSEAVADMESTPKKSLWKCGGFRCVFDNLRDRIGKLRQDFYEWRKPQQKHGSEFTDAVESYTAVYEEDDGTVDQDTQTDSQEEGSEDDSSWWHISERPSGHHQHDQQRVKPVQSTVAAVVAATVTPSHTPFAIPSIPPPDKSLVMTLVLAAVAFTVFSLSSICLIRMRYTPEIERRPRPSTHRETREERCARLAMRREAVKTFFRRLFCGIFSFSEKDCPSQGPQGRDLRAEASATAATMPDDNDSTTTMEQELAGFREAASMVSNLIAAEEGRHRMMQRTQPEPVAATPPVPIPTPNRHMYAYPGYNYPSSGLASPPSYEVDTAEASMVSDGFRYSPGQFEFQYSPSSSPGAGTQAPTSNSDRLGYGNKD